ncbi:MAG: hypothetical protein ACOY3N_23460 [Bradyrhizobium sp.]|uniref:hypothetical protein n=1 Tax=Bradyrhizobium sp. TaxID=376 RepID=UPI003BF3ABB1
MMLHHIPTPEAMLLDRLARMAEAVKAETRWQVLARKSDTSPIDAADYRKMRPMLVTALAAIRRRDVAADVLDGLTFWDAVEAYARIFALLIQHRRGRPTAS